MWGPFRSPHRRLSTTMLGHLHLCTIIAQRPSPLGHLYPLAALARSGRSGIWLQVELHPERCKKGTITSITLHPSWQRTVVCCPPIMIPELCGVVVIMILSCLLARIVRRTTKKGGTGAMEVGGNSPFRRSKNNRVSF